LEKEVENPPGEDAPDRTEKGTPENGHVESLFPGSLPVAPMAFT